MSKKQVLFGSLLRKGRTQLPSHHRLFQKHARQEIIQEGWEGPLFVRSVGLPSLLRPPKPLTSPAPVKRIHGAAASPGPDITAGEDGSTDTYRCSRKGEPWPRSLRSGRGHSLKAGMATQPQGGRGGGGGRHLRIGRPSWSAYFDCFKNANSFR